MKYEATVIRTATIPPISIVNKYFFTEGRLPSWYGKTKIASNNTAITLLKIATKV